MLIYAHKGNIYKNYPKIKVKNIIDLIERTL